LWYEHKYHCFVMWYKCHLPKSSINILSLIYFAPNGLLITSCISDFSCDVRLLWEIHSRKTNYQLYMSIGNLGFELKEWYFQCQQTDSDTENYLSLAVKDFIALPINTIKFDLKVFAYIITSIAAQPTKFTTSSDNVCLHFQNGCYSIAI
jgi:hypothetical protein